MNEDEINLGVEKEVKDFNDSCYTMSEAMLRIKSFSCPKSARKTFYLFVNDRSVKIEIRNGRAKLMARSCWCLPGEATWILASLNEAVKSLGGKFNP